MRLERLQGILKSRNSKHLENVKHQYFRDMRMLEKKYFEAKPSPKRNIIKDYTEFDSNLYAPLVRDGPHMDVLNPAPHFQFVLHRDIEAFQELTESKSFVQGEMLFDMNNFKQRIKNCELSETEKRLERKLEKIYATFKDWQLPKKVSPFERPEPGPLMPELDGRLSAPLISLEGENEEGRRKPHCITLQKIARGRVVQKMIRKEISENMNELLGMKLMFDMDPNCLRLEEGQMQKLMSMKKQTDAETTKDTEVKEVLGHLEGETLNKMLEFLDKEMIRLIDERKVHALILMAERERRRKEAMEAGRRFVEEENRRTNDEMFRQIVGIHQATVDIYLEDIYIESSDRAADEASRNYVRQMASTLNEVAYSMPTEIGEFEKEELAAEIVSGYIVPELSRLGHQEKLNAAQTRYKKAASQVLDAVFGAHELLKQIVTGPLPPIVQEHSLVGWAATDGSASAVDDLIKQAVDGVIKAEDEAEAAVVALRLAEAEAVRLAKEEEARLAAEEEEEENDPDDVEIPEFVPPELPPDAQIELGTGEPTQMEDESIEVPELDDQIQHLFEDPTIVVADEVREKMAAKALQIELDLEPGAHVETLYAGLRGAIDEIILEARRTVVPDPKENEDIEIPNDADSDDD
ncbi:cilia- and flagella-associated protein 91 [Folsomia candida]|nr:cilia- and flagella-associated protein 91 [Folsomia candida]